MQSDRKRLFEEQLRKKLGGQNAVSLTDVMVMGDPESIVGYALDLDSEAPCHSTVFGHSMPACIAVCRIDVDREEGFDALLERTSGSRAARRLRSVFKSVCAGVAEESDAAAIDELFSPDGDSGAYREMLPYVPRLGERSFSGGIYVNRERREFKIMVRCSPVLTSDSLMSKLNTTSQRAGEFFGSACYRQYLDFVQRYTLRFIHVLAQLLCVRIDTQPDIRAFVADHAEELEPPSMAVPDMMYLHDHVEHGGSMVRYYNGCSRFVAHGADHITRALRIPHPALAFQVVEIERSRAAALEAQNAVLVPLPYDLRHELYNVEKIHSSRFYAKRKQADSPAITKEAVARNNETVPFVVVPGRAPLYMKDFGGVSTYDAVVYFNGDSK